MVKETYRFAGLTFEIEHEWTYFTKVAEAYIVPEDENSIKLIATKVEAQAWKDTHPSEEDIDYPLYYLETLVIHSKLADILAKKKTFIFHGSTIYLDSPENAYIITAPSGTGKSTHSRLLKSMYGDRIQYINDDKPFIQFEEHTYSVYGSPWDGKERRSQNIKGKLKGIFIIERALDCSVEQIAPKLAINQLIKQIHIPTGLEGTLNGTEFIVNLCKDVPIYLLKVDMSENAPKTSYEIMKGSK